MVDFRGINVAAISERRRRRILECFLVICCLFTVYYVFSSPGTELNKREFNNNTNIIILAYARSGSSYTADLFSSIKTSSYFFEPLLYLRVKDEGGMGVESMIKKDPEKYSPLVEEMLEKVFDCDNEMIKYLNNFKGPITVVRKPTPCAKTNPKIIKTIRLHRPAMVDWMKEKDWKVIHLVRDPRGMIKSVKSNDIWKNVMSNATNQCLRLMEDLRLEQDLGDNYIRVRYEDIAKYPQEEMDRIFQHFQWPMRPEIKRSIYAHTHATHKKSSWKKIYYSTFRSPKFDPNHWKKEMAPRAIENIEKECKDVMEKLGYQPISHQSAIQAVWNSLFNYQ